MIAGRTGRIATGAVAVGAAAALATVLNLQLLDEGSSASPPFSATGATGAGTATNPGTPAAADGSAPSRPGDDTTGGDASTPTTARPAAPPPVGATTSPLATPPMPPTPPASAAERRSYQVGEAGSVTLQVDGTTITLVGVSDAPGWSHEVREQQADHLEIRFRSSSGAEAELQAELEHGELRVEINTGDDHDD